MRKSFNLWHLAWHSSSLPPFLLASSLPPCLLDISHFQQPATLQLESCNCLPCSTCCSFAFFGFSVPSIHPQDISIWIDQTEFGCHSSCESKQDSHCSYPQEEENGNVLPNNVREVFQSRNKFSKIENLPHKQKQPLVGRLPFGLRISVLLAPTGALIVIMFYYFFIF